MTARWLLVLCAFPAAVLAQPRPRMAVLPVEAPALERAQRSRLSDVLAAAVVGTDAVELAPTIDVTKEYERKYEGSCPANEVLKCLAYLAEHTTSTYALRVELRRGARAKSWEWVAALAAHDETVLPQPDVFPFMETGDIVFDKIAEQTLKRYVETLNLKALPIVPARRPDVVTVKPPDGTKIAPPIVTKPVAASPMKTVGWVTAGVGGAAVVVGGIMIGAAQSTVSGLGVDEFGNVPAARADDAKAAMGQGTTGAVVAGVGAAVAVGGVVMALMAGDEPAKPKVTVVPMKDGAVFAISGSLP